MPQTVLGLDIGSYSVKAALFDTTFRSFALTDLFESAPLQADELDPQDRPVVITEAILRLMQENKIKPQTIVTALSGMIVSTRLLKLPLPERQVSKVLPFEMEAYIPFELDEVLVSEHTISSSKTETICLAAAVRKLDVAEHLSLVKGASLEPAFVGLDSLALYNLNHQTLKDDSGTYAIVDIGHKKTSICIVSNYLVQQVRTLFTAGYAITESIRNDLDLTLSQAMEVKHSHSILELESHPLKSADLRRLSLAIQKAINSLIQEILQTFHSYRSQKASSGEEAGSVERVYLCGGSSLTRNLPEYLTSVTNIPAQRLKVFSPQDSSGEKTSREPIFAQAVSLGLRAAARGPYAKRVASINFRLGDFAFARDLSGLKDKAIFFGKWIATIFLVALLHVGMKYQNLASQKRNANELVLREFRKIVPDVKNPPKKSSEALKTLRERIKKYQEKQEILTAGLKDMTALSVLRELHIRIPQEIPLDAQELSIDRNKVTLRANTDSFESVDKVILALKENSQFQKIDKGDIRESSDGRKTFQLTLTIGEKEKVKRPNE